MRILWNSAEKFAAITAVLCSIPALIFSALSWSASHRAIELAEQDFISARMLILKADYDVQNETFHWSPVGDGVTIQTCTVIFPPSLHMGRSQAIAPDFQLPMSSVTIEMQRVIGATVQRPPKDKSLVSLQNILPVFVEATYLAKGELRHARSCYDLTFWLSVSDHAGTPPEIDFKSALFMGHGAKVPEEILDTIWNRQLKAFAYAR